MDVNFQSPFYGGKHKHPVKRREMKKGNNIMLGIIGLVEKCFPWVFALILWLIVIGGAVGGIKTAESLYAVKRTVYDSYGRERYSVVNHESDKSSYIIVGGAIGLISGFLAAVLVGGVVTTLLQIDENLQYLADKEKARG